MTLENFSEVAAQIDAELSKTKATRKESLNAQLLLEETFMRLVNIGKAQSVNVKISQRLGDLNLIVESTGEEFNPLISVTDYDEDDEDYFRTIILKSNAKKMTYARKGTQNLVIIQIHENANKQLHYTLIGMSAGIIFGLILKFAAPIEFIAFFEETISGTVQTMFMSALNMMIAPVVFFSIISGITGLTDAADVGRIGGKLIGLYSVTTTIAAIFGLTLAYFVFSGDLPQIGIVEGTASTAEISILDTIKDIIPSNLIAPIVNRDLLQVIFVAVFFGLTINKLGDKVKLLNNFAQVSNTFCLTLLATVTKFIPLVVFLSMSAMVVDLGLDSMILLLKLLATATACDLLMVGVYSLLIPTVGKMSPIPFLKKLPSFIPIPFATSSSSVTMPFTMKFCNEKLGISPKLSSFSIPIGATVNMDGTSILYSTSCIMLLKMYGVEIDSTAIFSLLITIFTLSIGTPGIPGGAIVLIAAILGIFGVPAEASAVVMGIYPMMDRLATCSNVTGDIAMATVLAANENLLDKQVYAKI